MKRNIKIFIYTTVIILGGLVTYTVVLPAFIKSDFFLEKFRQVILQKTGFEINIDNLVVKTGLKGLKINADDIFIDNYYTNEFIILKDLRTNINLITLITGNIKLNNTFINRLKIRLGNDYTELLTQPKVLKKFKNIKLKNFTIIKASADISGQKLINDIKIKTDSLKIYDFNLNKKIKTDFNLSLTSKDYSSVIYVNSDILLPLNYENIKKSFLNANINNLNTGLFSKIAKHIFKDVESIEGVITGNIDKNNPEYGNLSILFDGIKVKFKNNAPSIQNTKPLTLKGHFIFDENAIYIQSAKILSELLKASAHGKISGYVNKNTNTKFTVSIDKSDISEFINLLPPISDKIEELDLRALKKNNFNGNVIGHLDIAGDLLKPNINGNILISDAFLNKPLLNAKKATIKLLFNNDIMTLDTTVPTAPREYVSAKGNFELYNDKRCILNVKSTQNIDLRTAQLIVNPLQDIIKLYFGPVPVMKLNGFGNININVTGNRIEPNITGDFNFRDGEASFNDFPNIQVKNMNGSLLFKDTNTLFETKSATLNSKPVNIKGQCDLFGKFDFYANTKSQNLTALFDEIKDNNIINDFMPAIKQAQEVKGLGDINLHIYGNLQNVYDMEINKNTFVDTEIELQSAGIKIKDTPLQLSGIFGKLSTLKNNVLIDLYALVNKSKIYINGKVKGNEAMVSFNAKSLRIIDLSLFLPQNIQRPLLTFIKSDEFINFLPTLYTDFAGSYTGSIKNIDYNNINLSGKLTSTDNKFKNTNYSLSHSNLNLSPLSINTENFDFTTSGTISNVFSNSRNLSGSLILNNFDLDQININALKEIDFLKNYTENIEKLNGYIDIKARSQNNNVNALCKIKDVKLETIKNKHEILSGEITLKNHTIDANKINARIFEMPVLLDGYINFVNNKPANYNFDIKAKPVQEFLNETFNKNALYPVKLKGNIALDTKINGNRNKIDMKSNLKLDKESSIYYLGATIGDKSDAVKINSDITMSGNEIKINDINYNKIVPSLNENENIIPVLNIIGAFNTLKDNNLKFNNLKIKSQLPVDAKIFNIIFRKPFVKEGVFTSDLILNGTSLKPEVLGKLDITSVELPFFESNINSINLNFTPKYIYVTSKGDVVTNEVLLNAKLKNDFTLPFVAENVNVHLTELDLNRILDKLKNIEEANFKIYSELPTIQPVDYTNFIVNNSTLTADKVIIDKIIAENFKGNIEIGKDRILNVKNFNFDMAEGSIDGNITHSYDDNKLTLTMNMNKANASNIAETMFNLKGQIFGLANGKINLNCNAETDKTCFSTLSGDGYFEIQDGKMPKLGSLEYLLKAGNLINNGITGLTINGLIDLLSPLKSGEFKNIKGDFTISSGIADDINIYSNGKDLNMYITGKYDLSNSNADFQIFGSLSKEITTLLNKVKNLSLNTLLKTIPIAQREKENEYKNEISKIPMSNEINNIYKFFKVVINGDINENGFVKSFEWLED